MFLHGTMKYMEQMPVMPVKLINYSKGEHGDLLQEVAYCARVSNPDNQTNQETSEKLLGYLIKHKHWSPFEMVSVCLEIKTSRDIARQILRHRSFSFQEFSQRYAKSSVFMHRDARKQDMKNRQNSTQFEDHDILNWFHYQQSRLLKLSTEIYDEALNKDIAKEQARAILPLNQYTEVYWTASFQAIMNFIELRNEKTSQWEIQEYAKTLLECMYDTFPKITEIWAEAHNW